MKPGSTEHELYKKIDFANRYETLSKKFQIEERLSYSNDRVKEMLAMLGYKARYVKKNDFFGINDTIDGFAFYLNICLKYSNVELIMGVSNSETGQFITGSVFGQLYSIIKYAEGTDLRENIKKPKFGTYEQLQEILESALSIYEDFKKETLNCKKELLESLHSSN